MPAGVLEQVGGDLGQPVGVAVDRDRAVGDVHRHDDARVGQLGAHGLGGGGGDVAQIHRPPGEREGPGPQPRQVQQVVHEPVEPASLGLDRPARGRRVRRGAVGQCLRPAADRGQRRAQVVGHRQQEVPLGVAGPLERGRHGVHRPDQPARARRRRAPARRPGPPGRRRRCVGWPPRRRPAGRTATGPGGPRPARRPAPDRGPGDHEPPARHAHAGDGRILGAPAAATPARRRAGGTGAAA